MLRCAQCWGVLLLSRRSVPLPVKEGCVRPGCGGVHERCHAHNSRGEACGRWPRDGAVVCGVHGGGTGKAVAAAERRVVEAEVRGEVARFRDVVLPVGVGFLDGLVEEFQRTVAVVRWLERAVDGLGADGGVDGRAVVEWELWQRERKHLAELGVALGRLGVDERRLRVEEAQAGLLVDVLVAGLDAAGVVGDERVLAVRAMLEKQRALSG